MQKVLKDTLKAENTKSSPFHQASKHKLALSVTCPNKKLESNAITGNSGPQLSSPV